ncbi:hypothetical protein [Sphingomonas solaris]|uniref:hypothetical protein n=1 Tax=Alterirhizorhabdus solaris TaxID=2529389 RepID=UPI0030B8399D
MHTRFGAQWAAPRPMDNRFNPVELYPRARAWVIREQDGRRGIDVGTWDVLGGQAKWPMTNVRQLGLPQRRRLAADPGNRCLIPLTEFAEWTPNTHAVGSGKSIKGEMWFACTDQPVFAVAGLAQRIGETLCWAMFTCDPNPLVSRSTRRPWSRSLTRATGTNGCTAVTTRRSHSSGHISSSE